MTVHDWLRVDEGTFHDFHVAWCVCIRSVLNRGLLSADYYARIEKTTDSRSDYVALRRSVVIRHSRDHHIVALVEIVSPGNKASADAFDAIVTRIAEALSRSIHVLVIDLFPPTPHAPEEIHAAVWKKTRQGEFSAPAERPLTLVSYEAGPMKNAYLEPIAVGDVLPAMPLFLEPDLYVSVPLEATYREAWLSVPAGFRDELSGEG